MAAPERPADPDGELSLYLPREWAPDLPAAERHALEAAALARRSYAPWLVYVGRGTAPDPPDHDRMLDRLRRLADRLCLDLVVEVRRRDRFLAVCLTRSLGYFLVATARAKKARFAGRSASRRIR